MLDNFRLSIPIGTTQQLVLEMDLAGSRNATNRLKSAGSPAYKEGFIFGIGSIYIARPAKPERLLLGDQELGNFMTLFDHWIALAEQVQKGLVELGDICSVGEAGTAIHTYLLDVPHEYARVDEASYDLLMKAVIEQNNDAYILMYSSHGDAVLEITWLEDDSKFCSTWTQVDVDELSRSIVQWRSDLSRAYFRFDSAQQAQH